MSDATYIIGAAIVSLPGTLGVILSYMNGRKIEEVHKTINSGLSRQIATAQAGAKAEGELKGAADERARVAETKE